MAYPALPSRIPGQGHRSLHRAHACPGGCTRRAGSGRQLIGWGMAGGVWEAMQMKASAKARLDAQGHLTVSSATTDIGTGVRR